MRARTLALLALAAGGCHDCLAIDPLTFADAAADRAVAADQAPTGDFTFVDPCSLCAADQFCATLAIIPPGMPDAGPPDGAFYPTVGCNPLPPECVADPTCACVTPYLLGCACFHEQPLFVVCGGG